MRVLVTGATGFVGYAVATALVNAGHDVVALCRSAADVREGVARVEGNLLDRASVQSAVAAAEAEAVCHLAALGRVRDSRTDPLSYWRTNVGGTLTVLEAMVRAGTKKLVVASTCAVYGERAAQPITESATAEPTNPYGTGKLAADRAIADLAATGAVGAVSLRAFNIAGGLPAQDPQSSTRVDSTALLVQVDLKIYTIAPYITEFAGTDCVTGDGYNC